MNAQTKKMMKTMIDAQKMFVGQINRPFEFGKTMHVDDLENYVVNALFPKMKEQHAVSVDLRNKFTKFIRIVPSAGEIIEVYGILDMSPVDLGLDAGMLDLFYKNFAQVVALQFTNQVAKKAKLTLELKETRKRFTTGGNALVDFMSLNEQAVLNGIARTEQEEVLQMFVQYYKEKELVNHQVSTIGEIAVGIVKVVQDLQDNVHEFNQVNQISDEYKNVTYTTSTDLENVVVMCTNNLLAQLSADIYPQWFHVEGVDFRERILSFYKFPRVITTLKDYAITKEDSILLEHINYLAKEGTAIPKGTLIPNAWYDGNFAKQDTSLFDIYQFDNDQFAFVFDQQALLYAWDEGAGWTSPFNNIADLTLHMYYHFTSLKAILPFYNMATVSVGEPPSKKPSNQPAPPTGLNASDITATQAKITWE